MIHQLMEAYGWSYESAMSRTLPQILMLTHASWVSHETMEKKVEASRKSKEKKKNKDEDDPVVFMGKHLGELTSDQMAMYYSGGDGW